MKIRLGGGASWANWALAVVAAGAAWGPGQARAVEVARAGKAAAAIVVPDAATETEQFAAEELRDFLKKISGATLAIRAESQAASPPRLFVGRARATQAARRALEGEDPEAFLLRSVGGDLALAGASDRGTLYAVYDLLQRELGCRWLAPGPEWEETPARKTIKLPGLDRLERPALRYRFLRLAIPDEPGTWNHHCLTWAVRQRVNIGPRWPQQPSHPELVKRGRMRAWMGPHSLSHLIDAQDAWKRHPEWFALVNGSRRAPRSTSHFNLCTTNPAVIEAATKGMQTALDACPDAEFLPLGPGDGTAFCECERCRALDVGDMWTNDVGDGAGGVTKPVLTERWLTFVDAVARRLQASHPGKKIYTIAYHQTFRPPKASIVRPEPNVMIQLVNSRPNYLCFVHRLERPDCPRHVAFCRGLEQWRQVTPAGLMAYQYMPHSTMRFMPLAAPHKFIDDIRYLSARGLVGYEGQSGPSAFGLYTFSLYAVAQAMWDPAVDADALVRDYCQAAFHEAAEPMERFLAVLEKGLERAEHITDGLWTALAPETMAAARVEMDAARAAARSEKVRRRLRALDAHFHYAELGARAWRLAHEAIAAQERARLDEALQLAKDMNAFMAAEHKALPGYLQVWPGGKKRVTPALLEGLWRRAPGKP